MSKINLPPYENYPEIISDTVVLRQVHMKDIKELIEISFYDSRPAITVEDATEMQEKINIDYMNGSCIHWLIEDRRTNAIVGTLGYYRGFDEGTGELGCVLKTEFRGKGYMTRALKLAIEFGLNNIGLSKITAITTKQNQNAIKLLGRLNFIKTADLQDNEIEYQFVKNF